MGRHFLAKEAYGVVEALRGQKATHIGLHEHARQTQLILEFFQTLGDGVRRPVDQAVLEGRLVREIGQILRPLSAQLTAKSASGLQQTLAYAVIKAHGTFPWLGESSLFIFCDIDAHTQHHIAVSRMTGLAPGLPVHGNSARQFWHCSPAQAGKDG